MASTGLPAEPQAKSSAGLGGSVCFPGHGHRTRQLALGHARCCGWRTARGQESTAVASLRHPRRGSALRLVGRHRRGCSASPVSCAGHWTSGPRAAATQGR